MPEVPEDIFLQSLVELVNLTKVGCQAILTVRCTSGLSCLPRIARWGATKSQVPFLHFHLSVGAYYTKPVT